MSRIDSFSDCVFAFAITLLVINLRLPATALTGAELNAYLFNLWPILAAFLLSFWVIYRFWSSHVRVLSYYKEVNSTFLSLNAFLLLFIVAMPFTTDVLSLHPHDGGGVVLYAVVFSAAAFLEAALWQYTKKHPELLRKAVDEGEVDSYRGNVLMSGIIFACSIPLGFFFPFLTELAWLVALLIRRRHQHPKVS